MPVQTKPAIFLSVSFIGCHYPLDECWREKLTDGGRAAQELHIYFNFFGSTTLPPLDCDHVAALFLFQQIPMCYSLDGL